MTHSGKLFGCCKACKGLGYIPRNPMPKGVRNGVAICLDCSGQGTPPAKD